MEAPGEERRRSRRRFDLASTARRYSAATLLSMYTLIMHTHECANARSGDRGEIARGTGRTRGREKRRRRGFCRRVKSETGKEENA